MLVLGRRVNETITIVDNRTGQKVGSVMLVRICRHEGGSPYARIGFDFPEHYEIARDEILEGRRISSALKAAELAKSE